MGDPGSAADLVARLSRWVERLWPDVGRADAVVGDLQAAFAKDDRPIDPAVCDEVQDVVRRRSRHFELACGAAPGPVDDPEAPSPGWPPPDPDDVRRRAGSVREVSRRADGIAVVRLDGLDDVRFAAPFVKAAFALTDAAPAVILDLRRNGGGDPGTVALVLDLLAGGPARHISDVVHRDRVRQWWTAGTAAARTQRRFAVLTGAGTFSSGEALAYHAQQLLGAPVVGQVTRGAADHITPVRVAPRVVAHVPEAYVVDATTRTNWEAVGVIPDLPVAESEAEEAAADLLLGDPSVGKQPDVQLS